MSAKRRHVRESLRGAQRSKDAVVGRILVFLGGLLVVVLFSALLAPLFVDWTDFRKDFEAQASRIIGKKVVVHGAVDARLLPFPSVTLHDVRVGQEADGTPLVRVERFSMDAELAPFLSGEALIFDMRIEEPVARVRLLKDGTLDWMRGSRADIPARSVVLENVHVTGGRVEFIDDQSGRTRLISDLSAEMSAKSLAGPWRIEGNAALDGEKGAFSLVSGQPEPGAAGMRLKSKIMPQTRPFEIELDGELKLVDSRPIYQGAFSMSATSKAAAVKRDKADTPPPRLTGSFELTNESMRVPAYRMEVGALDDPYVITGEATLDTGKQAQFLLTAEGQQIDVNRFGNQGERGKTGRNASISAKERLGLFMETLAAIPVPQVPGKANLRLPAIVIGDTTIRDVKLDVRPAGDGWAVDNAVATLPGRTQIEAKGMLSLGSEAAFSGEMLVASNQPSGLASWLSGNVDPAIRKLKSVGFSALVSLTPELQRFERLEFIAGQDILHGRLERQALDKQAPSISMDLNGNTIDFDVLRAIAGIVAGQEADSGLLDHRIAAQLKASKFIAFGVEAENVDTVFTVADGALSLERLTVGNLAGAALTAIGRAEGTLAKYTGTGRMTFQAFDPGPFLTMLRQHLPPHPAIDRLVRNAAWFANSDLKLTLALGGDDGSGLSVKMAGVTNGSRVNLDFRLADLMSKTSAIGFDATLENPVTSILFGQAGFEPLPLEADSNGVLAVRVKSDDGTSADTTVTFNTQQTAFSAGGKVDLSAANFLAGQMKLTLESADIEPYLIMNALPLPQIGTGLPLKATADLAIDAAKVDFQNLAISAGGNTINGGVSVTRDAPSFTASADLKLATADLGTLAELVYGPLVDAATSRYAATPLPKLVGGLSIAAKVAVQSVSPGLFGPIRDFTANLGFNGEQVTLDDIQGNWSGGKLSGRLSLGNANGNGFLQTQLAVADGDTAAIVWQYAGSPVASGKFRLEMSAEATGKSVADLFGSASGSGELGFNGTRINGLNLAVLPMLIPAVDAMQGELTQERILPPAIAALDQGETELPPFVVPFNLTSGIVRAQNVAVATDQAQLSADAAIDLAGESLQAGVAVAFNPGAEALSGAEPGITLNYAGPIAAPQRTIDAADLSGFLSLRAFERERRRVERLQSNVLEKQRLRREVALYKYRADERQAARERAAAEEQMRRAEEIRLRQLAREAERLRREALAKAAQEKAEAERRLQEQQKLQQQAPAATPDAGSGGANGNTPPLNFDVLPKIQ